MSRQESEEELESQDEEPENLAELSDSSDEEMRNRIGDVPLEWYDNYDHIGYDVSGKPIIKKAKGDSVDELLSRRDDKDSWRKVYDAYNDQYITLTDEEVRVIQKLRKNKPLSTWEPGPEFLNNDKQVTVFGNMYEPKRRFIPSKWEAAKVVKYVHAMRNGWLKMPSEEAKEAEKRQKELSDPPAYLLWGDDGKAIAGKGPGTVAIAAPKPLPPGHAESYNPPEEYLFSEEEKKAWELMEEEDRPQNFIPQKYSALRSVPLYSNFIRERFDRCLDLYLCPRAQKKRLKHVDPESLIPKLPKPKDLRPFPTVMSIEFKGHTGRIRSVSVSPTGQWLASGSDDCTVRIWEVDTGRCCKKWTFSDIVDAVAWNPLPPGSASKEGASKEGASPSDGLLGFSLLLAVAVGTRIIILNTQTGTQAEMKAVNQLFHTPLEAMPLDLKAQKKKQKLAAASAKEAKDSQSEDDPDKKKQLLQWKVSKDVSVEEKSEAALEEEEEVDEETKKMLEEEEKVEWRDGWSRLTIRVGRRTKSLAWHQKGDYLASVGDGSAQSVMIHRISRHHSHVPFSRTKGGLFQKAIFHPTKPFFFVASQRHIRIYNLMKQQMVKKLQSPAKWISTLAVHPGGDHLLVGSYDRRVSWYDLDMSTSPYKTLKYHTKAVRGVDFHRSYPLFATASDDGNAHIFHATVYTDLVTNPLLVPVKILKAHEPRQDIGVLDCVFHPFQPWLFTSGADHMIRLWTNL